MTGQHLEEAMVEKTLAEKVEAAIPHMHPPRRSETPDYAQIDADGFMMMTCQPDAIMGLLEALPEIATALRTPAPDDLPDLGGGVAPQPTRNEVLEEAARQAARYLRAKFPAEDEGEETAAGSIVRRIEAALSTPTEQSRVDQPSEGVVEDWWKPDPEDPFWMLEVRQGFDDAGAWLKNEHSYLLTRDASRALRFPSRFAAECQRNRLPTIESGRFEPTEHTWFAALTKGQQP